MPNHIGHISPIKIDIFDVGPSSVILVGKATARSII